MGRILLGHLGATLEVGGYRNPSGLESEASVGDWMDGTVQIVFAPEGRGGEPLSDQEIGLVRWVIEHEEAIHNAMLKRLFDEYPLIREQALDWFEEDEADRVLPRLQDPDQLREILGISSINVHQIERHGKPFIGVGLGCTWDLEHGVGMLLHGDEPLEMGGADTAILLWIARRYLRR